MTISASESREDGYFMAIAFNDDNGRIAISEDARAGHALSWVSQSVSGKLDCKHPVTVKLSSIQKVKCMDCYNMINWPLKDGQQPLVSSSRGKRSK
jgi:hypothetical protein